MGKLEFKRRKKFISDYKVHVTNAYKESTTKAIQEEIALTIAQAECLSDVSGINIASDARHGWRKNAKD